jgi:hypothetical protein
MIRRFVAEVLASLGSLRKRRGGFFGSMDRSVDGDATLRIRDIELRFRAGMHRPPPSSDEAIYVHKGFAFVAAIDEALARIRPRRIKDSINTKNAAGVAVQGNGVVNGGVIVNTIVDNSTINALLVSGAGNIAGVIQSFLPPARTVLT